MTGAEAIALARRRGVTLRVFLGKLRVCSESELDDSLVRLLRDNKQAIMDAILTAETESYRWRRTFAEKAETIGQLRGMTHPDAECEAFKHVLIEYLNTTHPDTDPNRCAHCGGPETPNATLLPIGVGERHAWLHPDCWEAWRKAAHSCDRGAGGDQDQSAMIGSGREIPESQWWNYRRGIG
jgi:hypothetical protein